MGHTEETIIRTNKENIELVYENGNLAFIVESIKTKDIPAPHLNIATGRCRKPKGKKLYNFVVKKSNIEGLTLVSVS